MENKKIIKMLKKMIDMGIGDVVSYGSLARIGFRLETNYYASK